MQTLGFLGAFAQILALCGTLAALISGIGQLTATARLRKEEEWLQKLLKNANSTHQRTFAEDLLNEVTPRLAASSALPARGVPLLSTAFLLLFGLSLALLDTLLGILPAVISLAGVIAFLLMMKLQETIGLHFERKRIALLYRLGDMPIALPTQQNVIATARMSRKVNLLASGLSM